MAEQREYVPAPLPPKRVVLGRATVRNAPVRRGDASDVNQPSLCVVTEGRIALHDMVDIFVPGDVSEGLRNLTQALAIDARIAVLRRDQDDATEVHNGFECHIELQTLDIALRIGYVIEAFSLANAADNK